MVKPRLYSEDNTTKAAALYTLKTVLEISLKLLHPYMPFVTEEIYCTLNEDADTIMTKQWPVYTEEWNFAVEEEAVEIIKEAVREIRNVRAGMNVPPSKKAQVYVVTQSEKFAKIFEDSRVFFQTLSYAGEVLIQSDKTGIDDDAVSAVIENATIYMPFAELVEIDKEIERLKKEEERLKGELARVDKMLSNEKFIAKAPQAKIDEEKEKQAKYAQMMKQVQEQLAHLQK